MTAGEIIARLEAIEAEMMEKGPLYESAARSYWQLDRGMELRLAQVKLVTQADTQTEKKDKALTAIAAAGDGLFENHAKAHAQYEALKVAIKVLETRASIGQSLLRTVREVGG